MPTLEDMRHTHRERERETLTNDYKNKKNKRNKRKVQNSWRNPSPCLNGITLQIDRARAIIEHLNTSRNKF